MLDAGGRLPRADADADAAQPVVAPASATCSQLAKLGLGFAQARAPTAQKAVEILTGAATPILDRWFESRAAEGDARHRRDHRRDGVAVACPGTAYVLFHHVMGECNGVRGVWGYVRGGMGGISNAIAAAARERGAEIRTNAEVGRILVKNGTVQRRRAGGRHRVPRAAGGLGRRRQRHLPQADGRDGDLPAEFVDAVRHIDYSSATLKINVALSELPRVQGRARHRRRARSTTARCTSARPWSTSSGPTTTPSTAARRRTR